MFRKSIGIVVLIFCIASYVVAMEQQHIVCFQSIDQTKYKAPDNTKGYNMCGLFATYNGLMMFKCARNGGRQPATEVCTNAEFFNQWLKNNNTVIQDIINRNKEQNGYAYLGDLSSSDIEALLKNCSSLSGVQYSIQMSTSSSSSEVTNNTDGNTNRENISIIEWSRFVDRNKYVNGGVELRHICNNIDRFRQKKLPQLILVVYSLSEKDTVRHWIAIVISTSQTWVMDSLNEIKKDSMVVTGIDNLFRKENTKDLLKALDERRSTARLQNFHQPDPTNVIDLTNDNEMNLAEESVHKRLKVSEDKYHVVSQQASSHRICSIL